MILSNRRYEITFHGDLSPLIYFYLFCLRYRLFTLGIIGLSQGEIVHKLSAWMPVGASPTILMRGLIKSHLYVTFFVTLKKGAR